MLLFDEMSIKHLEYSILKINKKSVWVKNSRS